MDGTAARIAAWVRDRSLCLGEPRVSRLGSGESYDAWIVESRGAQPLVVRVARRPLDALPRPMAVQPAALPLVPAGLGPRFVLSDESSDVLGGPFLVTSYVPGQEVAIVDWTDELLVAHAGQLAALHAAPFERCGDVLTPEADRQRSYSLAGKLDASLEWWRTNRPEAFDAPEVAALLPRVEAHVAAAEPRVRAARTLRARAWRLRGHERGRRRDRDAEIHRLGVGRDR